MTSLVTGANGFVGSALCRALCARQQEVRAFVRQGSDTTNLADLPVTLVHGDLRDRESLHRAMEGCRFVYHVAATIGFGCRILQACTQLMLKAVAT